MLGEIKRWMKPKGSWTGWDYDESLRFWDRALMVTIFASALIVAAVGVYVATR